MAASQPDNENTHPSWILKLKSGGSVPFQNDLLHCSHAWSSPPAHLFRVRASNYLQSKLKSPANACLLTPLAFDWIKSASKISNIMKHPHGRVRAALEHVSASQEPDRHAPFVWVFNLQVPSKENHSLIMYYASFHHPPEDSLVQRFLDGDTAFRNSRLKLLANVVEGPWIVKKAVGEQAICLLGKAVSCNYVRGDNFIEMDVDIGSSMMANAIVHLAFGYVTSLTVDLAFVLEGQTPSELPERILGTIRFANLDPASASSLDSPIQEKFREKSLSMRLWRSVSTLLSARQQDPVANVEDDEVESSEAKFSS